VSKWRAYGLLLFMLLYTPFLLWADARWSGSVFWQLPLGALTFAVLALATVGLPATMRRQVWLLVGMATILEVTASPILGLYRYRFGDVPLYVPPGHGLVYLCAIGLAATPLGTLTKRLALPLATAWAVLGLTLIPLLGGRLDVEGALCWIVFAWFMTRSRRAAVFGVVFFATSFLELVGTSLGTWTWSAVTPLAVHIPAGNPPSVISGMYCVLDGSVLVVYRFVQRARQASRLEHGVDVVAPASALGSELAGTGEAAALQGQLPAEQPA
jgi:hypothetical protein